MKHLIFTILLVSAINFLKSQAPCDLHLQNVEFNSQTTNPQPILTIKNVGTEPITTAQIQWGLLEDTQSIWPFSSSAWGGVLQPDEVTTLTMPEISVPQGSWTYVFRIIALNNFNPNFGPCVGIDDHPNDNMLFVEIHMDEDGCIDDDGNGFCDEVVSVGEITSTPVRIISVEYFDLTGRILNFEDLEQNRIYIRKTTFENQETKIQKIIKT
jgi:hypothetical protein